MLLGSALRRQAYFHYQKNRVEMQPSLFLSSRDSLLSRPVVMTDVSCEWQHCFGEKGESTFPALPSDSSSSHQEWRFLTNMHLLCYQEDRQSHFAKTIQGFRMMKPIPQPPRKSQYFWDLWPFLQDLGAFILPWGVMLGHLGRLIQTSGIQMAKSVSDFPERQRWVGLHFQLSPCCIRAVTI